MTSLNRNAPAHPASSLTARLLLLTLTLLLSVPQVLAAPPPGKGGGNGGGGGTDSGPQPERHLKWRVHLDGPYSQVRPVLGADGTVYAVDVHDHLVAVSPDGTVQWTASEAGSRGVDVGPDGTIYTGNEDWIKAYNPDGGLKWTFIQTPRAFVFIDIAVGPDGNIYAVGSSGMGVFSLEDTGGAARLRWTNPEAYDRLFVGYVELAFGPTADGRDQQLYFTANRHTRAVRLSDGASMFTISGGAYNNRPQVSRFDGSWHRNDSAFSPNGDLLWSFEFPLFAGSSQQSLAPDGTHYTVVSAHDLYAIDPVGSEEHHNTLSEFAGNPDVDPTAAQVVVPTQRTTTHPAALLGVSAANGSALWRVEFPSDPSGLDPFIDSGVTFTPDGRTAYVMTAVATTNSTYLNAIDTDPSIPNASTVLRAVDTALEVRSSRKGVNFTGVLSVLDENRRPVAGAEVFVTWTFPDGTILDQVATSGGNGVVKFSVSGEGGLYTIEVTDMQKTGYAFDARHSLLRAARAWF